MLNGYKAQILVVDDDRSIREALGTFLMSAGYDVATAEDGIIAVSLLSRAIPDLIVTDLNMPRMSGVELISHVRSYHPSVSIVAMSGDYQGDAVPAGIIADWFYPKGQHPQQSVDNDRKSDRDESGPRGCSGQSHSPGAGLLNARRKICSEPS